MRSSEEPPSSLQRATEAEAEAEADRGRRDRPTDCNTLGRLSRTDKTEGGWRSGCWVGWPWLRARGLSVLGSVR